MKDNNRILVVDDNRSIHDDFRKILGGARRDERLMQAEAELFGQQTPDVPAFDLSTAFQGEEAIALAEEALRAGRPFSLAFMDVRMPPGMDGVTAARKLWEVDPDLQIVICSAHADYTWTDMAERLGRADRWVILRKPFDNIEVMQLAQALTEKWALRRQTKAHVAELEHRVAEQTADLRTALDRLQRESEERLRAETERRALERKVEEAQRLESLGVLAGGIAHDFNNILTGILGSASLARLEGSHDEALNQHLLRIELNSRRAAELCEQMLAYAGKGQVVLRQLNINAVLRETLELLHVSVPKDADFTVDLAAELPDVKGDPARLRQVFMNLVLNAAEALAAPPRRLRLTTRFETLTAEAIAATTQPGEAKPGAFICVEVTDTGVGITSEALRRIFEPFYTTKFAGRGLGLCAVLGIVRSHGGALAITSRPNKGTTFRVYFPALKTAARPVLPATLGRSVLAGAGRVLLVDDEESVRAVAAAVLQRQGFAVISAGNGVEALAQVQRDPSPLTGVVLDLTMPQMDGVETLQKLRAIHPGVPAVLISGFHENEAMRRFAGMEPVRFLQKPFTVDGLMRAASGVFMAARESVTT